MMSAWCYVANAAAVLTRARQTRYCVHNQSIIEFSSIQNYFSNRGCSYIPKKLEGVLEMGERATPNISFTERANLVKDHICSAALFARNAFEIERVYKEQVAQDLSEQLTYDHTAYVIGSIIGRLLCLIPTVHIFSDPWLVHVVDLRLVS